MATIFFILLIVFALLALASLLVGVFAMGKGGSFNQKNSNLLMRYRVLFQAGAVVMLILFLLAR